jgi:hypothetical protein
MTLRVCGGGILISAVIAAGAIVTAQEAPKPAVTIQRSAQAPRKTYNETADAKAQVAAAIKAAAEDDIRVFINWGSNEDARCTAFTQALRAPEITEPRFFADEYKIAAVDIGKADKNQELALLYGAKLDAAGLPHFTILDSSGKVLAQASAREFLKEGDPSNFDPKKVARFLAANKAKAVDAQPLFDAAMSEAGRENKYVFLWFSAPW